MKRNFLGILSGLVAIAAMTASGEVTFNKDVAPILYKNCTGCHRDGEVAPFALLTYDDAKRHAKQIRKVTQEKIMPPWKAETGCGEFLDARFLTAAQLDTIKKWVDGGAIEGSAKDLPPAPKFVDGWQLGQPDMILKMPEAYHVPAEGTDIYRCFVIPVDVPADRYVKAVEYRPGNRRVVHHAIFYLDTSGEARKLDDADPGPGYTHFGGPGFPPSGALGGWAPGVTPKFLPDGVTRILRKGADLVLQTHFHPSGKPEVEQSTIGIYLSKEPPKKIMLPITLGTFRINIPAGEKDYHIHDSFTTPVPVQVVGITPHAHLLGKQMKCTATLPDGTVKSLLSIKDWDFNWQEQYRYAKPFVLPADTRIDMDFSYDNSSENPRNPTNPPKRVTFGEGTTDEMAFCWVQVIPEKLLDLHELGQALVAKRGHLVGASAFAGGGARDIRHQLEMMFDKNADGVLDDKERAEAIKFLLLLRDGGKQAKKE